MNRKTLIIIAVVLGVILISLAANTYRQIQELDRRQEEAAVPSFIIPPFEFTSQEGVSFGSEQLKGQVWIANFIFSRCPGPCLRMTKEMAKVQKGLQGSDIRLVSFTVDPDFDKPDILKAYGKEHGADFARWTFVTGDRNRLHDLIQKGFKLTVAEATPQEMPETGPFIHSTLFVVVGKDGKTLGYLDGSADDFQDKMEKLLQKVGGAKS